MMKKKVIRRTAIGVLLGMLLSMFAPIMAFAQDVTIWYNKSTHRLSGYVYSQDNSKVNVKVTSANSVTNVTYATKGGSLSESGLYDDSNNKYNNYSFDVALSEDPTSISITDGTRNFDLTLFSPGSPKDGYNNANPVRLASYRMPGEEFVSAVLANSYLNANSQIIKFTPKTDIATAIQINFPTTATASTYLDFDKITLSDFVLTDITTAQNTVLSNVYAVKNLNYQNLTYTLYPHILQLVADTRLIKDHTYMLKLSDTSSGDEIRLPGGNTVGYASVGAFNSYKSCCFSFPIWYLGDSNMFYFVTSSPIVPTVSDAPYVPNVPTAPSHTASEPVSSTAVSMDLEKDAKVTEETTADGQSVVKVAVDTDKLKAAFNNLNSQNPKVVIEVKGNSSISKVDLPSDALLAAIEQHTDSIVQIKVKDASYNLPVSTLKDLKSGDTVSVLITKVQGKVKDEADLSMNKLGVKPLLSNPIDFSVTVNGNALTDFGGSYVDRSVSVGMTVDPDKVTAIWVDESNQAHFVPSTITNGNGQSEITIHSPHNSLYTVVQSNNSFADLQGHWAKADIELLANKLIVNGVENNAFSPDSKITRAEFAALLVRSLGLVEEYTKGFNDVVESDWYAGVVGAAQKAGLIQGFENGSFKPHASITREQMAAMIVRALAIGGKEAKVATSVTNIFTDRTELSDWSKEAVAQLVSTGIVHGVTDTTFAPKEDATRAQAATMLKLTLQKLQFIN